MFAFYLFVATLIAALASVVFFVAVACGKLEAVANYRGISERTLVITLAVLTIITCLLWPVLLPALMYNQYKSRKVFQSEDTVNFRIVD